VTVDTLAVLIKVSAVTVITLLLYDW